MGNEVKQIMNNKAQGTTEYLIILAVIIVVALVVAGIMGFFPGLGTGISESQSRAYWQSTTPLAITQYDISEADADLVLRNQTTDKIGITDITLDGVSISFVGDVNIVAGGQATVTGTGGAPICTQGDGYQMDVVITYDVVNGLTGAKLTGNKALVGTCS